MVTIIEDSRQKKGEHKKKNEYWDSKGVSVLRCKLPFGDYALPPRVAVDTKKDMNEIATNLSNDHRRVANEVERAYKSGCKLVFLVENKDGIDNIEGVKTWNNPRRFVSPKAIKGETLYKIMHTMERRYECEFQFCSPEESGKRVMEILNGYKQR